MHGIARDLAAAGLGTLKPVDVAADRRRLPLPDRDPHRRSRRLPGLLRPRDPRRDATAPSPDWLQRRLKAVGQRPISALVDMTNFIMLELRPAAARL